MCLYPRIIQNQKYVPNKKNGGVVPIVKDRRVLATPIGCGFCIECKNQEAAKWQVRMSEDVRVNTNGKFVTLTFSNESIAKIVKEINKGDAKLEGYELDNAIATYAVRDFCERWRARDRKVNGRGKGKSVRHWFITELGHKGTENVHLHGIVWTDKDVKEVRECWKWGYSWVGKRKDNGEYKSYVNEKTVNYIIKYVKKMDKDHKYFKPKVLGSPGIGKGFMDRTDWEQNKYKEGKTDESYKNRGGFRFALPRYYRDKIYNDDEKELLWLEKLDKNVRYVLGKKIDVSKSTEEYEKAVKMARLKNDELGYGGKFDYDQMEYEKQRRVMLTNKRIETVEVPELKSEGWDFQSSVDWG